MSYYRGNYGGYGNYGRSNDDYYPARQPSNRQWDRKEAAASTDDKSADNKKHDDGNYSARNYDGYRAPMNKPANNKYGAGDDKGKGNKEEEETYGTPASRQTYDPYASGCEKKPFQYEYDRADRGTKDPPPRKYGGGYQRNQYTVNIYEDDNKNEGENEQIRKDFANRFTLSPGRRHAVEKKDGEPSNGQQPQVVVIKKLEFKVDRSKIENLGMKKGRAK